MKKHFLAAAKQCSKHYGVHATKSYFICCECGDVIEYDDWCDAEWAVDPFTMCPICEYDYAADGIFDDLDTDEIMDLLSEEE